jgi:peptidoglycan/LPS O-acetylase OafA/YrhL
VSTPGAPALPGALVMRLGSSHLPALDGLRAVAVLLVILYHFGYEWIPGPLGVLIFFVLSGFLITWLLLAEEQRAGGVSLPRFYLRRSLRIFPAFYAYFFLCAALLLATGRPVPWGAAASALFYVGNYHSALADPAPHFVSHAWSLAVEEQFYLLWPALFVAFRKDLRKLTWCLVALIGGIWVYRAALHLSGVSPQYLYYAFDARADHLFVGCLLAVLLRRGALAPLWRAACAAAYLPLIPIGLLVVSTLLRYELGYAYRNLVGFIVDPLLVAVLIAQLIAFGGHAAWRWLDGRVFGHLGRISYPLYLYQQVTLMPARELLAGAPAAVQLAAGLLATLGLAWASFYLVERPFLRLKTRFGAGAMSPPRPAAAIAAPAPRRAVAVVPGGGAA